MTEKYCGVKFRTIFNTKRILSNDKILELINWCKEESLHNRYIKFPEELFISLTLHQAELIVKN